MDEQQLRIKEDLTGLFRGELQFDSLTRSMYASDASLYHILPLGVVFPRHHEDVETLVRYSTEENIPLIARGAGTSVTGAPLGRGLIVDFSRHMNNIISISEEEVVVQPGVVRDRLNSILKPYGRYFPPDPENSAVTTIGSMLAIDAAGSRAVRIGSTRDHVRAIRTVISGGQSIVAANEPLSETLQSGTWKQNSLTDEYSDLESNIATSRERDSNPKRKLVSRLYQILQENQDLINDRQPPLIRNCCGYYLRRILTSTHLDLVRLLVGSEGTLGLFTEAVLHTSPLHDFRGVVLLLFGRIEEAVSAVDVIQSHLPSACDLLDRRLLSLAREVNPQFAELIHPSAEAALIVEQNGYSSHQVQDRIRSLIQVVKETRVPVIVGREAYSEEEVAFLWSIPRQVVPPFAKVTGTARALHFVEDIVVPTKALHEFLIRAQKVFQKHHVTASLYAHAASGQLHLRPYLEWPSGVAAGQNIEAIARDLYQIVFLMGGSISGEHGDGLLRTAFIRSQYGSLYKVFQQIKDVFDPHNLMNPGKIISDESHITIQNFRPPVKAKSLPGQLQLAWELPQLAEETSICNKCGGCKTLSEELRMCPFYRLQPSEETSPRSKATVLQNVITGTLDENSLVSPEMKQLASYCFNCKQCELECPSNVSIPRMMIEAKAAHVAVHGLARSEWLLSRAHSFGEMGSRFWLASNWILRNGMSRWILERLFGIAKDRKLPQFARRSYLRSAKPAHLEKPTRYPYHKTVVYFIDHYANYHDPQLASAFIQILEYHGYRVYVPPLQTGSGMAMVSAGDIQGAKEAAEQNVRELADLAAEGVPILCTEPAAALCLKEEYPSMLNNPDVHRIAQHVLEAGEFLEQLHNKGELKTDFQPLKSIDPPGSLKVGYHTPCHLKALHAGTPFYNLLQLIPDLELFPIEKGCSGMAGTFGLSREYFKTSIQIGWGLIARMNAGDLHIGTTECSSCKIQMEQGTTIATLHPIKLLALAYGLMPELANKLKPSGHKRVVT